MIDLGANLQAATDAARFSHAQGSNTLSLESNLYELVGAQLKALGHKVESVNGEGMGGYQAIWYQGPPAGADSGPNNTGVASATPAGRQEQPVPGVYRAASDHRKDGEAVGW
jgi:gamma-glutamyltranspeptidase / glutathione hydrolase